MFREHVDRLASRRLCMVECKKLLRLVVDDGFSKHMCRGYYHPRGCLSAGTSHIDLEPDCSEILRDVAFKRGLRLRASCRDGVLVVFLPMLNRIVRIRVDGGRIKCGSLVYVMITRGKWIYLGGVEVVWDSPWS